MNRIKTGIASFGLSGRVFHAPFIEANTAFELVSICERSKNEALITYPHVQLVRSFEELISNPELELIIINTPDITHYDYCKAALEAGKNVIVEKPFVFTVEEGAELVELAEKKQLLLTVFQNRRWDCDFLTMQKVLKENRLGRIVEFRSSFQRYKNHIVEGSWKEKKNRFVGIVYNLGPHLVDQAVCLFGKPEGVFAQIRAQRDGSLVDDFFQITLIYKEVHVLLTAGLLMKEPTANFVLHGTNGSYVKYGVDPQEDQLKAGMKPTDKGYGIDQPSNYGILNTEMNGESKREVIESIQGDYMQFFDNVALSIREKAVPAISAKENLTVIKILEAAFQSHDENRVILLND
jgi:predicted dehydrogenase